MYGTGLNAPCRLLTLRAGWLNQVFTLNCHFFLKCWWGMALLCFTILPVPPESCRATACDERKAWHSEQHKSGAEHDSRTPDEH